MSARAACPARSRIRPPRRRVLALDWQVLFVEEVDRHHVARLARHQGGGEPSRSRAGTEDQPDLVVDAGFFDVSVHLLDVTACIRRRAASRRTRPVRRLLSSATRAGVFRRPRADEHDVGELHQPRPHSRGRASLLGERATRAASGSWTTAARGARRRARAATVGAGDDPAPSKPMRSVIRRCLVPVAGATAARR